MGRGSRMSMRYDLGSRAGDEDGGGSGKSTLKGMFKNKNKKSKQIELDALRYGWAPSRLAQQCREATLAA